MDDEVIKGPDGNVRMPVTLEHVRAEGFLLCTGQERMLLDVLGEQDASSTRDVVAPLSQSP